MRHFQTPSGRRWTACEREITHGSIGRQSSIAISGIVLRFASPDGITFDLEEFPAQWMSADDATLVELLRLATTPTCWPDDWMSLSDDAIVGLLRHAQPVR
ncbi:MAG: hypothetical protein WD825_16595 [Gemmatimonadaceae bacterium]